MIPIAAAIFSMGADDDPSARLPHRTAVNAFEIDASEVQVSEYQRCVDVHVCEAITPFGNTCNTGLPGRENHPINCVDWTDADTFCRWAGKRLPTEEEWEYAARGSDGRRYPWGDTALDGQACWGRSATDPTRLGTCEVGSHPAGDSPFGVHDLAGNVFEWTASTFSTDEGAPLSSPLRVLRGGSWADVEPNGLRATARGRWKPDERLDLAGIRCVRSR